MRARRYGSAYVIAVFSPHCHFRRFRPSLLTRSSAPSPIVAHADHAATPDRRSPSRAHAFAFSFRRRRFLMLGAAASYAYAADVMPTIFGFRAPCSCAGAKDTLSRDCCHMLPPLRQFSPACCRHCTRLLLPLAFDVEAERVSDARAQKEAARYVGWRCHAAVMPARAASPRYGTSLMPTPHRISSATSLQLAMVRLVAKTTHCRR